MLIHDFDSCQNSYEGKQLQPASTSILIPFAENIDLIHVNMYMILVSN